MKIGRRWGPAGLTMETENFCRVRLAVGCGFFRVGEEGLS